MARKSWKRNSDGATRAPAAPGGVFDRCCLRSGRYDGALRNDYWR
nr:hypothetical protein [Armatimonas sp.]